MKPVPPFGVDAARLPVLGRPLAEAVEEERRAARAPESLRIAPDVFVNATALSAFRKAAPPSGGRLVIHAPGWAARAGGPVSREVEVSLGDGKTAVELDAGEARAWIGEGEETGFAAPRLVAARVTSFADLLWVNLFAMASRVRNLSPAKGLLMISWAALRALSLHPDRVAGKLVARGRGCRIHPSAVVEASVLGSRVQVGAGAVVRGSWLGEGVVVEEQALVTGSVLGSQAKVLRQAMLKFSLLDRAAVAGGTIQLSVFGEGAVLRSGSYTLDRRLDGTPVKVPSTAGGLMEGGLFLGCALGPKASVGSGIWIGPGRAIPAGATLVRGEADVVTHVPEGLEPGVYAVADGTLTRR